MVLAPSAVIAQSDLGTSAPIGVRLARPVIVMMVVVPMPGMPGMVKVVARIDRRPARVRMMMVPMRTPTLMPGTDHHRAVPGAEQRVQQHAHSDQDGRSAFHQV